MGELQLIFLSDGRIPLEDKSDGHQQQDKKRNSLDQFASLQALTALTRSGKVDGFKGEQTWIIPASHLTVTQQRVPNEL